MGYEELLSAINKPNRRRCGECDRMFTPTEPRQGTCPDCQQVEPDPARAACPRCVHGRPEPASWCGWACSANRAIACKPGVLNALWERKAGAR